MGWEPKRRPQILNPNTQMTPEKHSGKPNWTPSKPNKTPREHRINNSPEGGRMSQAVREVLREEGQQGGDGAH